MEVIEIDESLRQPGQRTAHDSSLEGEQGAFVYTRGTSNATALATRAGLRIYEMLADLQTDQAVSIPDNLTAVVIKALIVHAARQPEQTRQQLADALKNARNSGRFKEVVTRYIGYGSAEVERVLSCTEQRVTVLGYGEIGANEVHEYQFPLPAVLSAKRIPREMIITLAWFSPINPKHRNVREAKLEVSPTKTWKKTPLRLGRLDGDHNQVRRGTVQHEVLSGTQQLAEFQDGNHLGLQVACKPDATEALDERIPYGLAVTLEVAEKINIYQPIRARVGARVPVGTT